MNFVLRHFTSFAVLLLFLSVLLSIASASTPGDRTTAPGLSSHISPPASVRDNMHWRAERVCGVNCLYLMLKHFKQEVDYSALESDVVRNDMSSLVDLKRAAAASGLATRIVRTDRRGLTMLPMPLIAHLDLVSVRGQVGGHFVLVTGLDDKEGVSYIDGTTAEPSAISWSEFEHDWSGYVVTANVRHTSPLLLGCAMTALGLLLGYLADRWGRVVIVLSRPKYHVASRLRRMSLVFCLGVHLFAIRDSRASDVPSVEVISQAFLARYSGIRTIRADYHSETTLLLNSETYYHIEKVYETPPCEHRYVIADDGRTYRSLTTRRHKLGDIHKWVEKRRGLASTPGSNDLSYADITAAMKEVIPTPLVILAAFDGTSLWKLDEGKLSQNGVGHAAYEIIHIPRLKSAFFPESPLNYDLWTFRTPALPKDDEANRTNRIPDLFDTGSFEIARSLERIGGDDCVVVSAPQYQTLWLLPDKGFAPRKRDFWLDGQRIFGVEFGDWRLIKKGAWIAGVVTTTSYGAKGEVPTHYEGSPIERTVYRLTKHEINDPSSELVFRFDPEAGAYVGDETIVADGRKGKIETTNGDDIIPTVTYQMPARREDLDQVVKNAIAQDGQGRSAWRVSPLLWLNVAVVAALTIFVLIRRRRS